MRVPCRTPVVSGNAVVAGQDAFLSITQSLSWCGVGVQDAPPTLEQTFDDSRQRRSQTGWMLVAVVNMSGKSLGGFWLTGSRFSRFRDQRCLFGLLSRHACLWRRGTLCSRTRIVEPIGFLVVRVFNDSSGAESRDPVLARSSRPGRRHSCCWSGGIDIGGDNAGQRREATPEGFDWRPVVGESLG